MHLDVTVRNADEMSEQEQEISRLLRVIKGKDMEIQKLSEFANLYLHSLDQLKLAKKMLDQAGLDSSFIKLRG